MSGVPKPKPKPKPKDIICERAGDSAMSMHRRLTPPPPNRHLAEFGTATSEGLRAMRERAGWSEEGESPAPSPPTTGTAADGPSGTPSRQATTCWDTARSSGGGQAREVWSANMNVMRHARRNTTGW